MASFSAKPHFQTKSSLYKSTGRRWLVPAVGVRIGGSDDSMNQEAVEWNAKHGTILKMRIEELQAKEGRAKKAMAEPMTASRPKLPPLDEITFVDVEVKRGQVSSWQEDVWARYRCTEEGLWDDELGHFGVPLH